MDFSLSEVQVELQDLAENILTDNEPNGDPHPAFEDYVTQVRRTANVDLGQNHGIRDIRSLTARQPPRY